MDSNQGFWPRAEHLVGNGAAVLSAAGVLLYGMIALAYDRFYRVLGISPRDVGLTQSSIVARTAVVLAVMAALAVAVYAALRLVAGLLGVWLGAPAPWVAALLFILVAPLVLVTTAFPVLLEGASTPYTVTVVVALALACAGTLAVRVAESRAAGRPTSPTGADGAARQSTPPQGGQDAAAASAPGTGERDAARQSASWWRAAPAALWVCALAVSYYAVVQGTTARAGELAFDVVHGACIPPAGRTFLYDVHADPVTITRAGRAVTAGAYDLYLGESDGWIALYDIEARRTIRESRDGLELHFAPHVEPFSPCS